MKKGILPYIYDFISILMDEKDARKKIRKILLFGSVATGEYDKKSDIDLFIDTNESNFNNIDHIVRESNKRFQLISEKKWSMLGINYPIKCIIGDINNDRWKVLRADIQSIGIVLYGKFETSPDNIKHYAMFNYSLSKIKQKEKVRLLRTLFGYKNIHKNKTYEMSGILEKMNGKKIGSNAIVIPIEHSRELQKMFNKFKITPEIREVWVKE
ncbi:MAG: nucleotidyltransferase domain-containing protein [Candidatus Aenigmatarchaeota archaeon]